MKHFFLILLIIVLIYLSVKPIEGFDASRNSYKVSLDEMSDTESETDAESETTLFSNVNIALFMIFFVLIILIVFIIIKLRSHSNEVTINTPN